MEQSIRKQIIHESLMFFGQKQFLQASYQDFAKIIPQYRDELYLYYPNMDALIEGIIEYLPELWMIYEPSEEEILQDLEDHTPFEMLYQYFITRNTFSDNTFIHNCFRFLYTLQYSDHQLRNLAFTPLIKRLIFNVQNTLDILIREKAIPPCDSRALAELWNRTTLVYGMYATHSMELVDYEEYYQINLLFIHIAVRGVVPIPLQNLHIEWRNDQIFTGIDANNLTDKDQVLLKALDLFSRKGYSRVSMQELAQELGLAHNTIYDSYQSKSEIMRDITVGLLNSYHQYTYTNPAFHAMLKTKDPGKIVLTLATSYPPIRDELVLKLFKILFREQYENEDLKDFFIGSIHRDVTLMKQIIDKLVKEGRVPPCDAVAVSIAYVYTMCSLTVANTLYPDRFERIEELRLRISAVTTSLVMYGFQQPEEIIGPSRLLSSNEMKKHLEQKSRKMKKP